MVFFRQVLNQELRTCRNFSISIMHSFNASIRNVIGRGCQKCLSIIVQPRYSIFPPEPLAAFLAASSQYTTFFCGRFFKIIGIGFLPCFQIWLTEIAKNVQLGTILNYFETFFSKILTCFLPSRNQSITFYAWNCIKQHHCLVSFLNWKFFWKRKSKNLFSYLLSPGLRVIFLQKS